MNKVSKTGVAAALGTFVVTAVFVRQRTVKAKSAEHALQVAEEQGLCAVSTELQAEPLNLSNWHAHEVDAA